MPEKRWSKRLYDYGERRLQTADCQTSDRISSEFAVSSHKAALYNLCAANFPSAT